MRYTTPPPYHPPAPTPLTPLSALSPVTPMSPLSPVASPFLSRGFKMQRMTCRTICPALPRACTNQGSWLSVVVSTLRFLPVYSSSLQGRANIARDVIGRQTSGVSHKDQKSGV